MKVLVLVKSKCWNLCRDSTRALIISEICHDRKFGASGDMSPFYVVQSQIVSALPKPEIAN